MPNVIWSELEGKSWKLDVGSTMEEAMSSNENNKLFVTTDGQIVMNGTVLCNGVYATLLHPDKLFSLTKYSSQEEILEAFTLRIDGYGEKTMTTADDVGNLFGYIYQFGFKVWCDNEQMSFLQVAIEEATKAMVFNISIERNLNGNTYKSCVRIKGESDGKGGATLTVLSSYKKRKINEPKISEPDFKVCVRKALPMHPRKGMKYYFDNGVRYSFYDKEYFDSGGKFTIPNDNNVWYTCNLHVGLDSVIDQEFVIPNGTVINKQNYNKYFAHCSCVLCRKTKYPVLITVNKDVEYVFNEGVLSETQLIDYRTIDLNCRRKYLSIKRGKIKYEIPCPNLKPGDNLWKAVESGHYSAFRTSLKRLINSWPNINYVSQNGSDVRRSRLTRMRYSRAKKYFVYVAKYFTKANGRIIHGPLCRYILYDNGIIKKRI